MKCYIVAFLVATLQLHAASPGITKIFHHRGSGLDQVVCYGTAAPRIERSDQRFMRNGKQWQRTIILLPDARCITEDAFNAIDAIFKHKQKFYSVVLKQEPKGLRLAFAYDPEKTSVSTHSFTAISRVPGVVVVVATPAAMLKAMPKHPTVVLDYGHGGKDTGARGTNGVYEKDLTLQIGKRVAAMLRKRGIDVRETRDRDTFISLDERATIANRLQPSCLVSLHINAGGPKAAGIETWFNDAQKQFSPTSERFLVKERASEQLAHALQSHVLTACSSQKPIDRKVKRSVSQVLMGTEMPSALIELGFCSNPEECEKLCSTSYQQQLAQGMADGIERYLVA